MTKQARMLGPIVVLCLTVVINITTSGVYGAQYLGKFIGKLSELHHGVSGEVYAVDGRTLFLKDFTYDGQGPAAYFYASQGRNANGEGFRLRDENGSPEVIKRYRKEGVTLTLPEGKNLNNIKIFYVWCEEFSVNFGDVKIPRGLDFPRPQKIEALKGVHDISSDNIVVVDAQTLLIPNLSFDGGAPDAKFWVGHGPKPSPQGIRVADENGKEVPLRRYDRKTVVLTLPGDLTVFDIGHFGIWCEAFTVDFGHVRIPQNMNVPPSLKMLGVSPQSKLNCEVLYDDLAFEVRWAVAGDSIVLQLVAKLDEREYMSFGVSGDDSRSVMIGGDVAVAWVDKETLRGQAIDYYLSEKSQCSGPTGSCPDNRLKDHSDNIRLLNAAMVNGYSIVTYQRPLKPSDEFDRQIHTNKSQAIIWAVGPLNQRDEVSFHSHYTKKSQFLDFGRPAKWNCPMPEAEQPSMKVAIATRTREELKEEEEEEVTPASTTTAKSRTPERRRGSTRRGQAQDEHEKKAASNRQEVKEVSTSNNNNKRRGGSRRAAAKAVPTPAPVSKRDAWEIPAIQCYEPEDGVFYAQMGPTGGKRGYPAITGHVGWGISWYINGLLIPEINVVRGKTYTFVVEGGFDPEVAAKYHPFYITDDSVGGYEYKTEEEKKNIRIFAGAALAKDGSAKPTGTGRLCHWTQQGDADADDFESFGAYQRTLELKCDQGEPGVIQWTPDKNTPDTVYYQCFTHRYLGWKINVLDSCDAQPAASEPQVAVLPPPAALISQEPVKDLEESPSVRVETRVKPNDLILDKQEDKTDKSTVFSELERTTTDPAPIIPQGQPPQTPLPLLINNEPILIQTAPFAPPPPPPQQSFFNHAPSPPPPLFLTGHHGPFSFNPYMFDSPFYYQQQPYNRQSFRPSPPLDFGAKLQEFHFDKVLSETTTTTTSTTTERPKPAFVPVSPPFSAPSLKEKIIVYSSASESKPVNQTFVNPAQLTKFLHNKYNIQNQMNYNVMRRPPPQGNKYRPHFLMGPPLMRPMFGYRLPPQFKHQFNKKPLYRPIAKTHPQLNRPNQNQEKEQLLYSETNHANKRRPQSPTFIFVRPQYAAPKKVTSTTTTPAPATTTTTQRNEFVDYSIITHQAEPEIQTAPPSQLLTIESIPQDYHAFKLPPAHNTGFHPESVVVESGFKPIISKEIERRITNDNNNESDYEADIGVIDLHEKPPPLPQTPESFEPVFVPSPIDNKAKPQNKRQYLKKVIIKYSRSLDNKIDKDIEPIAEAADRVETYYLPPQGQGPPLYSPSQIPSNIDLEEPTRPRTETKVMDIGSPPDVVVTYDGRKVSGASLTGAKFTDRVIPDTRASKAAELIKARPQFAPFRGELPPLDPEFLVNRNLPSSAGVISRDLDTPPASGSTKLSPVREFLQTANNRRKRGAYWKRESNEMGGESMKSGGDLMGSCSFYFVFALVVVLQTF